jgi:predicted MPP superfamily phosphohydrolase
LVKKFVALYDLHYGYERKNGHKVALHDPKAMDLALRFTTDFQPDVIILGGDILDCGAISHHNKNKPGRTEGLRILSDGQECARTFIEPLNRIEGAKKVYITGNHEDWLQDLVDEQPALEGLVSLQSLLPLNDWTVIPQGEHFNLGKLSFVHGDQLAGGEHVAKSAVITAERNIRFGHHHTYQVYTKSSFLDYKNAKNGIAVPCLCTRTPKYGEGKANRWQQGINYGYVWPDGTFADQVSLIVNGRMVADGRLYTA